MHPRKILNMLASVLRSISVEPVLILTISSIHVFMVPSQLGLYRVLCQKMSDDGEFVRYTNGSGGEADCWNLGMGVNASNTSSSSWSAIEVKVQETTASWQMIFAVAYTIPCMFADMMMGAYGDEYGRKYNLLLGIAGTIITMIPYACLFARPAQTPMYGLVLGYVCGGLTGFVAIVHMSAAAYIADTVPDRKLLTIRMTIVALSMALAEIIGPLIAKGLLGVTGYLYTVVFAIGMAFAAFVLGCLILKQVPPKRMRRLAQLKAEATKSNDEKMPTAAEKRESESEGVSIGEELSFPQKLRKAFEASIALTKAVYRTFTRKREGHRRAYIGILSAVVFLSFIALSLTSGNILSLFVQKSPYRWDKDTLADYKSTASALALTGSVVGIVVFKKYFQLPDTLIIIVALASSCLRCLVTALSWQTWMMFASSALGLFSPLVVPCVQAFVAKIVDPDEVGKAYTAFSIGTNLAFFANMLIFTAIYRATVGVYAGFVYLLTAVLFVIVWVACVWIHADYHGIALAFWKRGKVMDLKF